ALDPHLVAVLDQLLGAFRGQPDPELLVLDLARAADQHRRSPPSPQFVTLDTKAVQSGRGWAAPTIRMSLRSPIDRDASPPDSAAGRRRGWQARTSANWPRRC